MKANVPTCGQGACRRFAGLRARGLIGSLGLAVLVLAGLLVCLGRGAPAVQASAGSGEVRPGWTSTEPISVEVRPGEQVWAISQHGMTLTFKGGAVTVPSVFTFTPQSADVLPFPYRPTPYFFHLWGTYLINGLPVSLGASGIEIELAYDEARLEVNDPRTLEAFYREYGVWKAQGAQVDLDADTLWFKTTWIGDFGVGGEGPRVFLALILNQ